MTMFPLTFWCAVLIAVSVGAMSGCASVGFKTVDQQERSKDVYSLRDDKGNSVRLHDKPCEDTPDWLDLREAEMHYQGRDYKACWFPLGQHVIVLDSNKDKSPVPFAAFKKETPI